MYDNHPTSRQVALHQFMLPHELGSSLTATQPAGQLEMDHRFLQVSEDGVQHLAQLGLVVSALGWGAPGRHDGCALFGFRVESLADRLGEVGGDHLHDVADHGDGFLAATLGGHCFGGDVKSSEATVNGKKRVLIRCVFEEGHVAFNARGATTRQTKHMLKISHHFECKTQSLTNHVIFL